MENKNVKIEELDLVEFQNFLRERENAAATIEKYVRDVKTFTRFSGEEIMTKELLLEYKDWLIKHYAVSSANSMMVGLNQFLSFIELGRWKLKRIKVQRLNYEGQEKELTKKEYQLLIFTAKKQGKEQLAMIMETMCATGIRVSELKFFRVEDIKQGVVKIWNKGKYRMVVLTDKLRKKLDLYRKKQGIKKGYIFVTRNGRIKDRSNIWREMKNLAKAAKINPDKIFPHNLRHLFARTFYAKTKNLIDLADILGHSSLEVTRIYTYAGIREWKRNIEKLDLLTDL